MPDGAEIAGRVSALEAQASRLWKDARERRDEISLLRNELVQGLARQEVLMSQMISELRGQQAEMKAAHESMSSFARGVVWLGASIGAVLVTASAVAAAARSWMQ